MLAFVAFAVVCVPAGIHLYGLIGWAALVGTPRQVHRRRASRWRMTWNRALIVIMRAVLNVRVEIDTPAPTGPVVFVANHRSTLDIFVINEIARRMGIDDVRWILKKQIRRRGGLIGRSCVETECAYIARGGPDDFTEITRAALIARGDRASLAIFPEGTRFRGRRDAQLANVLPPRPHGLRCVVAAMPDYPIASVTLDWGVAAHTVAASVVGRTVRARVHLHDRIPCVETWLAADWIRKDQALAA